MKLNLIFRDLVDYDKTSILEEKLANQQISRWDSLLFYIPHDNTYTNHPVYRIGSIAIFRSVKDLDFIKEVYFHLASFRYNHSLLSYEELVAKNAKIAHLA